jgi:hypothetical protein
MLVQVALREAPGTVGEMTAQCIAVDEPPDGRLAAMEERGKVLLGQKWFEH